MKRNDEALVNLGAALRREGYRFTTVTPLTHARANARPENVQARTLEDIFGWSRPFNADLLKPPLLALLDEAQGLQVEHGLLRSKVRFSSLGDQLFVHSSFPTEAADAVFFGPDTYRFVRAIIAALASSRAPPPRCLVDIGCGSGAGGLAVAASLPDDAERRVILGDVNETALRFAQVNARINGVSGVKAVQSDVLRNIGDAPDLIIANPPYLLDPSERLYRHGGGTWGGDLSLRILREGVERLSSGGRLLLYTGTPVVKGQDQFLLAARRELKERDLTYRYEEIDPDVFGEELDRAPYRHVDRIAAVLLAVIKTGKEFPR